MQSEQRTAEFVTQNSTKMQHRDGKNQPLVNQQKYFRFNVASSDALPDQEGDEPEPYQAHINEVNDTIGAATLSQSGNQFQFTDVQDKAIRKHSR